MWPFEKKQRNPADVVPDGPYYRVVYDILPIDPTAKTEKVYCDCSDVGEMRRRLLERRRRNRWAVAHRSDDLGNTWKPCDDMGRPLEPAEPEQAKASDG